MQCKSGDFTHALLLFESERLPSSFFVISRVLVDMSCLHKNYAWRRKSDDKMLRFARLEKQS